MEKQLLIQLQQGARTLNIPLQAPQTQQLLEYLQLLSQWGRVYNLTGIHEPSQMVTLLLLESIALSPYLRPGLLLDVGSGAGIPGIPLAIANPQHTFHLLEKQSKRINFLRQVVHNLQLKNVTVIQAKTDDYQPATRYDVLLSRAFSSLANMIEMTQHLLADDGMILAMKGKNYRDELHALPPQYTVIATHRLRIPGIEREHYLLEVTRNHPVGCNSSQT